MDVSGAFPTALRSPGDIALAETLGHVRPGAAGVTAERPLAVPYCPSTVEEVW